jgi:hypothetical protein
MKPLKRHKLRGLKAKRTRFWECSFLSQLLFTLHRIARWAVLPCCTLLSSLASLHAGNFALTTESYGTDGQVWVVGYTGTLPAALVIPATDGNGNNIVGIDTPDFDGNTTLTSIVIGDNVQIIGTSSNPNTFSGCTSVTSVTIGKSVNNMANFAFQGCTALSNLTISQGCSYLGQGAFQGCTTLTSLAIPGSVTKIDSLAFSGCAALSSLSIGSGVQNLQKSAFANSTALLNVTIPSSVTTMGDTVFNGCTSLTAAIFLGDAPAAFGNNVFGPPPAPGFQILYGPNANGFTTPLWKGYAASPGIPVPAVPPLIRSFSAFREAARTTQSSKHVHH